MLVLYRTCTQNLWLAQKPDTKVNECQTRRHTGTYLDTASNLACIFLFHHVIWKMSFYGTGHHKSNLYSKWNHYKWNTVYGKSPVGKFSKANTYFQYHHFFGTTWKSADKFRHMQNTQDTDTMFMYQILNSVNTSVLEWINLLINHPSVPLKVKTVT